MLRRPAIASNLRQVKTVLAHSPNPPQQVLTLKATLCDAAAYKKFIVPEQGKAKASS